MRHADDGSLRRLLDEEWAVGEPARQHVARCARCQERLKAIEALRDDARRRIGTAGRPESAAAALGRQRLLQAEGRRARVTLPRRRQDGGMRWASGLAAFAAVLVVLAATPAGGYARNLLLIFEPVHFAAVNVKPGEAKGILPLKSLGSMTRTQTPRMLAENDLAATETAVGFHVLTPDAPAGLGAPSFAVLGPQTQSFTLSAQKLEAYAAAHHVSITPMPADISGSVLSVTTGPVAVMSYGSAAAQLQRAQRMPPLVVAEAPLPKVFSTGATVAEIENYLLDLPGISPEVSAQIRAIADPTRTMPIPVPLGRATSQSVMVGASQGLWVEETQGNAGGVVWTAHGYVYGVAGTLGRTQLLSIAATLH